MTKRAASLASRLAPFTAVFFFACDEAGTDITPAEPYTGHETLDDLVVEDGKADGISAAFDRHLIVSEVLFEDPAELVTAERIQALLETSPYGGSSWLADEWVGNERFSEALFRISRQRDLSPLIMLARLQVESSLVSKRDRPNQAKIDRAFGCGCHDGQACFSNFLGFERQLECAADTLRGLYDDSVSGAGQWRRSRARNTLDGYRITPANHATAAMYAYTPWVLPNRGGNWLVWNVTKKLGTAMGLSDNWVGVRCASSASCQFDHKDEHGICAHDLFYGDYGDGPSVCTAPCEGTCLDRPGHPTTFCADIDLDVGLCMSKTTGWCASGNTAVTAKRYIGPSSATPAEAKVCVPNWMVDAVKAAYNR